MSRFFLLPSRLTLGRLYGELLTTLFPGLTWRQQDWLDLAELLGSAAQSHPDVFVVYREDLPDDVPVDHALRHDFGAQPGDEVVEVTPGPGLPHISVKTRLLGDRSRVAA